LRIAFIDSKLNLERGGGSNYSLDLVAAQLANLGHQVMVITLCPSLNAYPENLPYTVVGEGLFSNRFDKKYRLAFLKALYKYESKVDVYHLWEPWLVLGAALYRRLGGKIPIVTYLNNYSFCTNLNVIDNECVEHCGLGRQIRHQRVNPVKKALLLPFHVTEYCLGAITMDKVDAFIAISPAVAEIYSRQHVSRSKIFIIPPALDQEYLRDLSQGRVSRPASSGGYNILYVGRLCPEKGIDTLIEAVSRLEFPLRLHVVGDGYQKGDLEQLSSRLGLSDRVIFHGWMPFDKVVDFYLNSQLFVHPARWPEPLGRTVLDAMALKVPVIAADSGGPPWVLQDAGLTFRPGDSEGLADKIRLVHGTPSLAADLATKGAERVKDFDYRKAIPDILQVYHSVIEAAKRK
jgi:glycosyltransferase involved in cell wall biosynthesis